MHVWIRFTTLFLFNIGLLGISGCSTETTNGYTDIFSAAESHTKFISPTNDPADLALTKEGKDPRTINPAATSTPVSVPKPKQLEASITKDYHSPRKPSYEIDNLSTNTINYPTAVPTHENNKSVVEPLITNRDILNRKYPADDHPWPMNGRDTRSSNRSPYQGPSDPMLLWHINISHYPDSNLERDSQGQWPNPIILKDGSIYAVGLMPSENYRLNRSSLNPTVSSVNIDGSIRWRYRLIQSDSAVPRITPAVNNESDILTALALEDCVDLPLSGHRRNPTCGKTILYSLTDQGHMNWSEDSFKNIGSSGSITLDSQNKIFFGKSSLNKKGNLSWGTLDSVDHSAILSTGQVVFIDGDQGILTAKSKSGLDDWSITIEDTLSGLSVGQNDNIYVIGRDGLYALDKNGILIWTHIRKIPPEKDMYREVISSNPAIAIEGIIYYINISGWLFAIDNQGVEKWSIDLNHHVHIRAAHYHEGKPKEVISESPFSEYRSLIGAPTVDTNGNIYVGINDRLVSFTHTGRLKWTLRVPDVKSSVTLGADGTLYFICDMSLCAVGDAESRIHWPVNIRMYCRPIVTDIAKFALEHGYGYTEDGYPSLTLFRYANPYNLAINDQYQRGKCVNPRQWADYENAYFEYTHLRRSSFQNRTNHSQGANLDLAFPLKGINGVAKSIFDPDPQIGAWPTCKEDIVTLCTLKNIDESHFHFIFLGYMSDKLVKLFGADGLNDEYNNSEQYAETLSRRLPKFLTKISISDTVMVDLQDTGFTGKELARYFYGKYDDEWVAWFSSRETSQVDRIRAATTSRQRTGLAKTTISLPVAIPIPAPKPKRPLCSAEMKSQYHLLYGKAHGFRLSVWIDDSKRLETTSGGGDIDTGRPYILKIPVCDTLDRSLVGKTFYIKIDGNWSSTTNIIEAGTVQSADITKPVFLSAGPTMTPTPRAYTTWDSSKTPTPYPTATPAPIPTSGWFTIPPRKKNPNLNPSNNVEAELQNVLLSHIRNSINELAVHPGFYYLPNWESFFGASQSYHPESAHRYLNESYSRYGKPGVCVVALSEHMNQHIALIEEQLSVVGFRNDSPECITVYLVSITD